MEEKNSVQIGDFNNSILTLKSQPMLSSYPPCEECPIWAKGSSTSNGLAKNEPVVNPINGIFGNPEIPEKKRMEFLRLQSILETFLNCATVTDQQKHN